MSVESAAQVYENILFGPEIYRAGVEEGTTSLLAAILWFNYGDDPRIPEIAQRIAREANYDISASLFYKAGALDDIIFRLNLREFCY